MSEIDTYQKFFAKFKLALEEYEVKMNERRARGIHDLNIFDVLETKEVKHSKFLSALLDPDGLHYQNDLFLREFVDICELKDFDFDISRAKVDREYKNIDIYITDGDKHIIIENKIGTGDHDEQIARYIQAIVDEQDEQDEIYERILVLYLTPFDDEIKSLGGIDEVGKDYLKLGQNQVAFKHISYKNEILKWIGEIKAEIANLTDLSVLITQYEKAVKNLTNQGEKMEDAIEIKKLIKDNYEVCANIYANFKEAEREKLNEFFKEVCDYLTGEKGGSEFALDEETWNITFNPIEKRSNYTKIFIISLKNCNNICYCIEPQKFCDRICFGFRRNNDELKLNSDPFKILGDDFKNTIENTIKNIAYGPNECWAFYCKWFERASDVFKSKPKDIAKEIKDTLENEKLKGYLEELNKKTLEIK